MKDLYTSIAQITGVARDRYEILLDGTFTHARLKTSVYAQGTLPYPTVGDLADVLVNAAGDSLILGIHPRRTYFARMESGSAGREQAVAANFDTVLIVSAVDRDFNIARLERYALLAEKSGAGRVFVMTKADLDADRDAIAKRISTIAPDAPCLFVSAHTGEGMAALRALAAPGQMLVLLGSSGVGKSSLVNALLGRERMRVNETRAVDPSKGRHTTTMRQMVFLPNGAMLIDTPGMRELGVFDAVESMADAFADITALACGCRFSDCRHETEPGCRVRQAVEAGTLDAQRLRAYQKLRAEAARKTHVHSQSFRHR